MVDPAQLRAHAEGIRASQLLGRSPLMHRLFDFLLECSLAGRAPKEVEVGLEVFGKQLAAEGSPDSMVRVYVHKLRRKLQEYYAGPGRQQLQQIAIPRGEYRLVLEQAVSGSAGADSAASDLAAAETVDAEPAPAPPQLGSLIAPRGSPGLLRRYWLVGLVVALTLGNIGVWFFTRPEVPASIEEVVHVRRSGIWAPMLRDDLPVYVVIGDYYLFGELDDTALNVRRLVRDFNINSRDELEQFLKNHPELAERYMDVDLQYLPISVAYALRNVLPLVGPSVGHTRRVQLVLASELTPEMLKSSHVVYIGLLSGLHILRDLVFSGSEFRIGDSYDELIDRRSKKLFVSEAGTAFEARTRYRDYGYFSTFAGPNGNRIVIIAGTRDVAVMHTAESVSHITSVQQLETQAHTASSFEALYSVEALDQTDLDGRLIFVGKLDTSTLWAGGGPPAQPPSASPPPNTR